MAVEKHLIPSLLKEAKPRAAKRAKEYVMRQSAKAMRENFLQRAPYTPPFADKLEDADDMGIIQWCIMAACHSPDPNIPHSLVVLDEHQELKDSLQLGHHRKVESYTKGLRDFVKKHMPHVIAVGTTELRAMDLFQDLQNLADTLKDSNMLPEGLTQMRVIFLDDSIASIFAKSERAKQELPRQPDLVCQAVGLARHLQDPLVMISNLATNVDDLLGIQLHTMQKSVDDYDMVRRLHREIINVVNAVGVDMNMNLTFRHANRAGQLQYVAGLGPRKAAALRQAVVQSGQTLKKREELVHLKLMGPNVFTNCAGFLMLFSTDVRGDVDILSETRIHPECYDLAKKMASNAMDEDERNEEDDTMDRNEVIERVMTADMRHTLESLDLEAYAQALVAEGGLFGLPSLLMIKRELENRGAPPDWFHYSEMNQDTVFEKLTGESDDTLFPGRLVTVTVLGIKKFGIRVKHEGSNLQGWISIERFSDKYRKGEDFPLEDKVGLHQSIRARVVQVEKECIFPNRKDADGMRARQGMPLQLTCRTSDLQDEGADRNRPPQYARMEDYERKEKKKMPSKQAKRKVETRNIDHPLWRNVTGHEAEKELAEAEVGGLIVRPGGGHGGADIKITWKFSEGVFVHINVKEEGRAATKTIGTQLIIEDTKFDDLDEIVALYIEPRVDLMLEMVRHRKFKAVKEAEAKQTMLKEKDDQPNMIPYMFCPSHEYPGRYCLVYSKRPGDDGLRTEYIMVMLDGFKFRGQLFKRSEDIIKYFKKHFKGGGKSDRNRSSHRK